MDLTRRDNVSGLMIRKSLRGQYVVLQLIGELYLATLPAIRQKVSQATALHQPSLVILDVAGVTFVDTEGLAFLQGATDQVAEHGGTLLITSANGVLLDALSRTGLESRLNLRPSIEAATSEFLDDSGSVE